MLLNQYTQSRKLLAAQVADGHRSEIEREGLRKLRKLRKFENVL
jgi:hypothetical protein